MEKKFVSVREILEKYKKGERNFSNIICKGADLSGVDLSGCNFSNSDLSFTDFSRSTLIECNFTETNLEWSDFTFADLSKSKFVRANITYSVLNDAIVDKTDFEKVDFSWSLLFNVNLHAANLKGAQTATIATDISQITEEGMMHAKEMLGRLKSSLPFGLWLALKHSIDKTDESVRTTQEVTRTISTYGIKREITIPFPSTGEYATTTKSVYTEKSLYGFETQYTRGLHKESREKYTR